MTDTVTTPTDPYLAPFAAGVRAGAPFLMPSTAYYSRIDPRHPAAFSPTVLQGLVRRQLGFTGVVISDDLGSAKQVARWTPGQRATMFIDAGGDMVLTVDASVVARDGAGGDRADGEQPRVRAQGRRGRAAGADGEAADGSAALSRRRTGVARCRMRSRSETDEQRAFRQSVRAFLTEKVAPHAETWEREGLVPRSVTPGSATLGVTGLQVPEAYGGGGRDVVRLQGHPHRGDRRHRRARPGRSCCTSTSSCPTSSPTARRAADRWCPGFVSGELMTAIAMTEPGTGSDLAGITRHGRPGRRPLRPGRRQDVHHRRRAGRPGVVVARTSRDAADRRGGLTLLVVEDGMPGFSRGRKLEKLGLRSQDTAELFFDGVRVPVANLLGEEGQGVRLPRRQPGAGAAWRSRSAPRPPASAPSRSPLDYVRGRTAFGTPVAAFQNTKFVLAGLSAEVAAGAGWWTPRWPTSTRGELSGADAARVKLCATELQAEVVDACLQLHGGYGYMLEYPIARMYADARVSRIYGGSSEIMKVHHRQGPRPLTRLQGGCVDDTMGRSSSHPGDSACATP